MPSFISPASSDKQWVFARVTVTKQAKLFVFNQQCVNRLLVYYNILSDLSANLGIVYMRIVEILLRFNTSFVLKICLTLFFSFVWLNDTLNIVLGVLGWLICFCEL